MIGFVILGSSAEEWIKTSDRPITKLQCSEIREHRHSINTERNRLQVDRFIDRRNQLMESKLVGLIERVQDIFF